MKTLVFSKLWRAKRVCQKNGELKEKSIEIATAPSIKGMIICAIREGAFESNRKRGEDGK